MRFLSLFFANCLIGVALHPVFSQDLEALTQGYDATECSYCAGWNMPQEPFQIHKNSYYVGTHGLSAILITSEDGHILIDAALPNSAPLISENIKTLGFDPADLRLILNTHVHYDHAGGIAAMQAISGARVAASPKSAPVLESGMGGPSDPQYGLLLRIPASKNVERFTPGDTLHVGPLSVRSHATAGHTPGGTSWSWESCDSQACLTIVYADSQTPVSADDFRYTDSKDYPSAVADFLLGIDTLQSLSCDILISTHPGATSLWQRLANGTEGLVDPDACKVYAEKAHRQLVNRLKREALSTQSRQ